MAQKSRLSPVRKNRILNSDSLSKSKEGNIVSKLFSKREFSNRVKFPQKIIDHYIENLKKKIRVKGVLLFDSFTWGRPTKHSDVDLIIISPDFTKKEFRNRLQWLSRMRDDITYQIAMDIFGYTPKEFKEIEKNSAIGTLAKKKANGFLKNDLIFIFPTPELEKNNSKKETSKK